MRRILAIGLIILLGIYLIGCGAKSTGTKVQSSSKSTTTLGAKSQSQDSKNSKTTTTSITKSVETGSKLIQGWPIDIPLLEGTIIQSGKAAAIDPKTSKEIPGKLTYATTKLTKLSITEIAKFYKSKFTAKSKTKQIENKTTIQLHGYIKDYLVDVYASSIENGKSQVQVFCTDK